MNINKHAVTIADEQYNVVSDESEAVIAQAVLQLNETIGAIAQHASFVDKKRIAVLAALQLSTELVQLKQQIQAIEQAQQRIARSIDQVVF